MPKIINIKNGNEESGKSLNAPKVFDEKPDNIVKLEAKHLDNLDTTWGFCLVGHFVAESPGKKGLVKLCGSWGVPCEYFPHTSGWIVFKFEQEEDREQVLLRTQYSVLGCTLLLKLMPPCFEFDRNTFRFIQVWIKLPGLPLECWNLTALSKIASKIGKLIAINQVTHTRAKISYARVLVEVDASAELVTSIAIEFPNGRVRQQEVEFDFVPKYCVLCQHLGHYSQSCTEKYHVRGC